MGRHPGTVVKAVLSVVPHEAPEVRARLEKLHADTEYMAPEVHSRGFLRLCNIMEAAERKYGACPWLQRASRIIRGAPQPQSGSEKLPENTVLLET